MIFFYVRLPVLISCQDFVWEGGAQKAEPESVLRILTDVVQILPE